jgi:hypothetical protein
VAARIAKVEFAGCEFFFTVTISVEEMKAWQATEYWSALAQTNSNGRSRYLGPSRDPITSIVKLWTEEVGEASGTLRAEKIRISAVLTIFVDLYRFLLAR